MLLLGEVQLPSEEGLQQVGRSSRTAMLEIKKCFYFIPDSSGSFSCAEIRAVSTSLDFPSRTAVLPISTNPLVQTKVQQKTTAQGRETPFKV